MSKETIPADLSPEMAGYVMGLEAGAFYGSLGSSGPGKVASLDTMMAPKAQDIDPEEYSGSSDGTIDRMESDPGFTPDRGTRHGG